MGDKLSKLLSPVLLVLLFSFVAFITIDNAPIHRDDVVWVELTRDLFSRDWSFFGEFASTGHFRHSILAPLINYPVAFFNGRFEQYIVYVIFIQIIALSAIMYFVGRKDRFSFSLIVAFVLLRPTFMLFHVHKVWQYTYYLVVVIAFFSALYSYEFERRKRMLWAAYFFAGLALHFHLSAFCLWPFLYIFSVRLERRSLLVATLLYVVGANVMMFQSPLVFCLCSGALLISFASRYSSKFLSLFRLSFIIVAAGIFTFELIVAKKFSPLTAVFEQLPSNGQFFFDLTSYYHFAWSHRWISFEIVMLIFAFIMTIKNYRFESFEGKMFDGILSVTVFLGFYGLLSNKQINPHHWHLGLVIGILFFSASFFSQLRFGRWILVGSVLTSGIMLFSLHLNLSQGGRGYYMTTYSKRLELLDEICQRSSGPVAVNSIVNSYIAWEFMINEHPCLNFTNHLFQGQVLINERLFPWLEPELALGPEYTRAEWINGEIWYRN